MDAAVLLLLVLLWAAFLIPGAIRARRSSPTSSVNSFERTMGVLASPTSPAHRQEERLVGISEDLEADLDPSGRSAVLVRRRQVLVGLAATTGASLLPAALIGGLGWLLFAVPLTLLAGYVAMLRHWKVEAERAAEVLRELPFGQGGDHPEPGGAAAGYGGLTDEVAAGAEPALFGIPPNADGSDAPGGPTEH